MRAELQRVLADRASLEKRWRDWLDLYRVPKPGPDGWIANFPFEGAPAYTFPVARMAIDPTWAKYVQSIHATPNIWTLQALNERWVPVVKPLQDYLQWMTSGNMIDMWDVNNRVILEMLQLGTGIYKTGWLYQRNLVMGYDQNMVATQMVKELNQPTVDHVHLPNFVIDANALSIDADAQGGARWVAERTRVRPNRLAQMADGQEPFLPDYDRDAVRKVLKLQESNQPEFEDRIAELQGFPASLNGLQEKPIELFECWVRFDTRGKDRARGEIPTALYTGANEDDIVVLFHKDSGEVLRATYNPYAHGKRPYHVMRFLRSNGFYGIGLCERAEMWQRMQSDILNADMAASILRNAPMWSVPENSNFQPGDPVFPGRIVYHRANEQPAQPLFMVGGQPGDLKMLLSTADNAARQDVGVTDLNSGMISAVPSRTPATTVQSLLQESATRIDMSLKDARNGPLSKVGLQILQNVQQQVGNVVNNPAAGKRYIELAAWVLGQPEGRYVASILQLPYEKIEMGVGVELTATSAANNKELSKQNFLAMMQIMEGRAPMILQMAQLAVQSAGSPIAQVAYDLLRGEQELMTRLMEQFDVRNVEDIVPNVTQALQQVAQPQPQGPAVAGPGLLAPAPFGIPGLSGI